MQRRTLFITVAVTFALLLVIAALASAGYRWLRGQRPVAAGSPDAITLCDLDASGVCVVSFGVDLRNRLVINLHLPDDDYPPFYASLDYGSTSLKYECRGVEALAGSAYCTGERVPLGGQVVVRLFASSDDRLLAEGSLAVMAIALPTFSNSTATTVAGAVTGTATLSSANITPTLRLSTSTPVPGYPSAYP
jgi:hypothetical protein